MASSVLPWLRADATSPAATAAKSNDPQAMAKYMHSGATFKTVVGDISYDKKGDVTRADYVVYRWVKGADGKITYKQL